MMKFFYALVFILAHATVYAQNTTVVLDGDFELQDNSVWKTWTAKPVFSSTIAHTGKKSLELLSGTSPAFQPVNKPIGDCKWKAMFNPVEIGQYNVYCRW